MKNNGRESKIKHGEEKVGGAIDMDALQNTYNGERVGLGWLMER